MGAYLISTANNGSEIGWTRCRRFVVDADVGQRPNNNGRNIVLESRRIYCADALSRSASKLELIAHVDHPIHSTVSCNFETTSNLAGCIS